MQFRENFRVRRLTTEKIIDQYGKSSHYKHKIRAGGEMGSSSETQCLIFLWFAGNKTTYRKVANLFHIASSTVHKYISCISDFLFNISAKVIRMPSGDEKDSNAQQFFQIAGFRNVLGYIDGTYIYVRKPANKIRSTYINRHGLLSITLKTICDGNKRFLDLFVGSPSKIHDALIYKLSPISKQLSSVCVDKFHIFGDSAYPLREYLLITNKDYGDLSQQQKPFNKKHNQTRVSIENSFALLKQRWRQLSHLDFFPVDRMCKFVLGCCVLHNLCIEEKDDWIENVVCAEVVRRELRGEILSEQLGLSETVLQHMGKLKRNGIAETF
ncbi:putative nuclease HARBI1 [Teleopsis dalmanni]|uniref:putative nuclease HARBI1 n=1 Tax=Teleopsis dalmanni TaxID=139649 RepID=UPI0018CEEC92|nr:putative nuclease HARBI1 [Teleopsis dalmanni]